MGVEVSSSSESDARGPRSEPLAGSTSGAQVGPSPGRVPAWIFAEEPDGGLPRGKVCAFCGEEAPPDSAFCPNDGRALTAALFPASGAPLTVLFTDIEDSVQLTERYGDSAWADIVDVHNQIVRQAIASYAGFEVKITGDGFLIVFADPVKAAEAAIDTQRRIAARGVQRPDWPVVVRMGLHRGDVILRPGGDILGRTVNMAQRVMDKSGGGEIWASVSVYEEAVGAIPEEQWLDRGMRRLRGVKGRQHLYELVWPASEASR